MQQSQPDHHAAPGLGLLHLCQGVRMVGPSGEQYEIAGAGYRAVVTESGGTLRLLEYDDRPLLDGFGEQEMPSGGRGQLLVPWPNRIRDGRYQVGEASYELPISEPARHNASHGLVRWVSWTVAEHTSSSVSLGYRLMAQSGYPWTLDLHVVYDLGAEGLTVTQTATNLAATPAPYASGAHPYLRVDPAPIDRLELTLPAATRLLTDERLLPIGREPVRGTQFDFAQPRRIDATVFDSAFTDLIRDERGRATVSLRDVESGLGVALWVDHRHPWLQVYSGDDVRATARRSLAVEPMTAPPDAFRSSEDLVFLSAAGDPGDEHSASWGLRALG